MKKKLPVIDGKSGALPPLNQPSDYENAVDVDSNVMSNANSQAGLH